jgi:sugar lactone lactonase YvrE
MFLVLLAPACRHTPSVEEPPPPAPPSSPPATVPVLAVSSYWGGRIHLFDPETGASVGTIRGVPGAQTLVVAPSGAWVACAEGDNRIVTVDPATLEVVGALVEDDPATPTDETGGLQNPDAAIFGPDGRLYVSSFETDQVLRYEADGTFVDAFVDAGVGGLDGPDIGLSFSPEGDLLVPGWYTHRIHRYDPQTGDPKEDLLTEADGLLAPRAIAHDSSGRAYVSGHDSGNVLTVDPVTGEVRELAGLARASGLALDEAAGRFFLANGEDDTVHVFDLQTGEDQGVFIDFGPLDGATAVALLRR